MRDLLHALIAWFLHHPRCPQECPVHRARWLVWRDRGGRPGFPPSDYR